MRRFWYIVILVIVLASTVLFVLIRNIVWQPREEMFSDIIGGFSINTVDKAVNASANGIRVVFSYGTPPGLRDALGQKLQALHMKVIDGSISNFLQTYECNLSRRIKSPSDLPGFCTYKYDSSLTDEHILLSAIAAHLQQMRKNPLIIGYWVLDDWVSWDAGSARQILIKIHQLIQQYTPGRPAICGFGGSIGLHQGYGWEDWIADNFSPQGCDKVGFYIYTSRLHGGISSRPPDAYNWAMSGILPAMFASLEKRGWTITKEPLIGIGQAFGGPIAHANGYWVTPTAKNIEIQSKSFCEYGAEGLTFYAWDDSGYGPTTQTPMNSSEIQMGIRNGIAACKQSWSYHS